MSEPDDLDRFRVPEGSMATARARRAPRPATGERFLRGPIPWPWLSSAARLPGRALHVGVALWMQAGLSRQAAVRLAPSLLQSLGLDRHAAKRGLRALEGAGLVRAVERAPGRAPRVEIVATVATAASRSGPSSTGTDGGTR